MSVILMCLFIAVLLPIVAKMPVAIAMARLGGYDNRAPREQQAQLEGFGARALAAHKNAFEALIMFTPAALAAVVTNTTGDMMQYLAIAFVVARVVYNACYLLDIHWLRSTAWAVGYGCSLYMLWQCI